MDIHEHGNDATRALQATRNWLANVSRRHLPSADRIAGTYRSFLAELEAIARELEFAPDNIPYVDFERIVVSWLSRAPAHAQ
jgi:hypothetical protein